jgi:tetratricopeptide (TPR) repeat protein
MDDQRMAATEDMVDALLRLGRFDPAMEHARDLLAGAPMRERAAGLLMRARYQAGDVRGALGVYDVTRSILVESLGVEPGAELSRLQRQILKRDPELTPPPRPPASAPPPLSTTVTVPRQLPADTPGFVGRAGAIDQLNALLSDEDDPPIAAVVISAIAGTAGVGKTALAVHWAHQVADRFPDGQVYVNLRGFDPGGALMSASEALRTLLEALDLAPQRIPASLDGQIGLYRSLLAGRRMLIVLDNARDSGQVRPLLPGTPGCMVVVTSRSLLSGLNTVEGARLLTVDLLTVAEARDMLAQRLGHHRVSMEPAAVAEIIASCARLPMALAIVAARAAAYPRFTLESISTQLRKSRGGLDGFDNGDAVTMRAVFSWSYQTLSAPAAKMFRLVDLHPGLDVTVPAAASLAGLAEREVRPVLAELAHAHLLTEHSPGRYSFHDLLRAYAAELAEVTDTNVERLAANHRVLDHYLHTAYAADRLLRPHRETIILDPPQPGVTPERLDDHGQALAWFTTEHQILLTAIQHAVATDLDVHAWKLAWAMENWLDWRGRYRELETALRIGHEAARRLTDPVGQAHTLRGIARAQTQMGNHDVAVTHLEQALSIFVELDDQTSQAATHRSLGVVLMRQGRHREALRHEQQALELHRVAGHLAGQAMTLNNIGFQHALLGEYDQALIYCRQALTMHQEIGDPYEEARTWDSLGFANSHLGHHLEAVACFQRGIALCRDLGDRSSEAETLTRLGEAHIAAGDEIAARAVWQRALRILEELGHPNAIQVRARLDDG